MPPTQVVILAPDWPYSHSSSAETCKASSRVGAIASISGASAGPKLSLSPSRVEAAARPKATVLPDPVWAETSMSASPWPSRTAAWTGVGSA
ncbi:hypothetical protein D3C80_1953090 [compost metagenome]